MIDREAQAYAAYLIAYARLVRLGVPCSPVLSPDEYRVAEDNWKIAGHNLTEWMLDHITKDPQDDPVGKALWDEVTRWERLAAM